MLSSNFRVLCVGGTPDICELISLLLAKRGHEVTPAEGPQEALDLLRGRRFDLYVLDPPMPRMTASELSRRIRQTDQEAKVVVFSDIPLEWDRAVAGSADVRGYVVKPDVAGLMRCVDGLLGEGRPSGEAAQEGRSLK